MPGASFFPPLALLHAGARAMLEALLASVDHGAVASGLEREMRDEYTKNKQATARDLAVRRAETAAEALHRQTTIERAFTRRVEQCATEVLAGRELAETELAARCRMDLAGAQQMVRNLFCPEQMQRLAAQRRTNDVAAAWTRAATLEGLAVAGIAPDGAAGSGGAEGAVSQSTSASFDVETFAPWPALKAAGWYAQIEMCAMLRPGVAASTETLQRVKEQVVAWLLRAAARPCGSLVAAGYASAVFVLHDSAPSLHSRSAWPTAPDGHQLLVLVGNLCLPPEKRGLIHFQRYLLALPAESPEAAAQAVFAPVGATNDLVAGIVVPSLMAPPHPMRWRFAEEHRLRLVQKEKGDGAKKASIRRSPLYREFYIVTLRGH